MSEIPLSPNKYVFILGLCLLILLLSHPVWPQALPIELFQATLTIERMGDLCNQGGDSKGILLFGFDWQERFISFPEPSGFCLMACFDPNTTIADGLTFTHEHHGGNEEWMVAFLPSRPLRGTWGIRIIYPEPHTTGDLQLTWKPKGSNGFPPGRFFIKRDLSNIPVADMINASSVEMADVANDEIVKIEYYNANCLFDPDIPSGKDSFEPDDDSNQAGMYKGKEQIHTFHDPNDTDWIVFEGVPEKKYFISLMTFCPLPIDPNIVPFEVSLVINGSPTLQSLQLELRSLNPPVYETILENITKKDVLVYLKIKINPEVEYLRFLPYLFSLEATMLNVDIERQPLKISAKNRSYIKHFCLKSNDSLEECKPPLPDKSDPNDPNFLLYEFICHFTIKSESFSLLLSDKVRDNNFEIDSKKTTNLDYYLPIIPPNSFPSPPHDADCDGIVGKEDPDPNHPNFVFVTGMNLYHNPFHPICSGRPCEEIDLCDYFCPYLLPDSDLRASQASIFIKQADTPGVGWQHYLIDSNCTNCNPLSYDIPLSYNPHSGKKIV